MRFSLLITCLFALTACLSGPTQGFGNCQTGKVRLIFDSEEMASEPMNECVRTGGAAFILRVKPEAEPINPSPWYDFTLETALPKTVTVNIDYGKFRHRYPPKQALATGVWESLPHDRLEISKDGSEAILTLPLTAGTTRIAAQEVIRVNDRALWTSDFAIRHNLTLFEIGQSVDSRPIQAFQIGQTKPGVGLVLILGGQHPPEVPGTLGLRAFLDALFIDSSALNQLLENHTVLVVPDLNPDGVARGHWRLNSGLIDLNRDWGPFTQPETQAVEAHVNYLIAQGVEPRLMLDFHATHQSVFYIPSPDLPLNPPNLVKNWLEAIDSMWSGHMPASSASHNPDSPTAKVWFASNFGAPGITVEFGDQTDRAELAAFSAIAAQSLLEVLNQTSNGEQL